jgi:hypothetical protein
MRISTRELGWSKRRNHEQVSSAHAHCIIYLTYSTKTPPWTGALRQALGPGERAVRGTPIDPDLHDLGCRRPSRDQVNPKLRNAPVHRAGQIQIVRLGRRSGATAPGRIERRAVAPCLGKLNSVGLHRLKRGLRQFWSIDVDGRWRILCKFSGGLVRYFGTGAAFWMNLPSDYNLALAVQEFGERISQEVVATWPRLHSIVTLRLHMDLPFPLPLSQPSG